MNILLRKGASKFTSGQVVDLCQILDFVWNNLSHSEKQNLGKEVYYDVLSGKYNSIINIDHVTKNHHAYYKIV